MRKLRTRQSSRRFANGFSDLMGPPGTPSPSSVLKGWSETPLPTSSSSSQQALAVGWLVALGQEGYLASAVARS